MSTSQDSQMALEQRMKENADLRTRMMGLRGTMQSQVGNMFGKVMGIIGKDVKDLLTDEQIDKVLR